MAPVVAEIALENKNTFVVARLDMDDNLETIRKYRDQIRGQRPVYIVFQDGGVVGRFAGETPKDEFVQKVLNLIDVEEN